MRAAVLLVLLAPLAACERPAPIPSEPTADPLVVGRTAAPSDAAPGGPARETWMTSAPDASAPARAIDGTCRVSASGSGGAPNAQFPCRVAQEYEHDAPDSGPFPRLYVWSLPAQDVRDPQLALSLARDRPPVVGVQPAGTFLGSVRLRVGATDGWLAENNVFNGTVGKLTATLTRVRPVNDGIRRGYEVHGTIDAQLVPEVSKTSVGWIDLHVEF